MLSATQLSALKRDSNITLYVFFPISEEFLTIRAYTYSTKLVRSVKLSFMILFKYGEIAFSMCSAELP
jgi:hypothetical protein